MALALNNLKRDDMPLNKETKPIYVCEYLRVCVYACVYLFAHVYVRNLMWKPEFNRIIIYFM